MPDRDFGIVVTRRPYRELTDGTLRVQIDVEPRDKASFLSYFPDSGAPMICMRITDDALRESVQKEMAREFGQFAKELRLSGSFMRNPTVWAALGSDKQYLKWLRSQKCQVGACERIEERPCDGDMIPAHVRRVALGAGKNIKPEFAAISLCNKHHQLQHDHGESRVGGRNHFEKTRVKQLQDWTWCKLKEHLRVESMAVADPADVFAFCKSVEIDRFLPDAYRELG